MFRDKQRSILNFPATRYDALICDGAIRSGKTTVMIISFIRWAMAVFDGCAFGICGKSVGSAERNIISPLLGIEAMREWYDMDYGRAQHCLTVKRGDISNRFYIFGGRDESSYTLIQGITLAGVLLDEVALMPRSFVEQAIARCSVDGSKLWFNCNPEGAYHWFKTEWVDRAEDRNALHLHFTLDDNHALSDEIRKRYETMYSGVFYQRYILGLWTAADGIIYDCFDAERNTYEEPPIGLHSDSTRLIAIDYGTQNPTRFLDIYDRDGVLWVDREYSWDGRAMQRQKTDSEYADDFTDFMGAQQCAVIVDPSAASFIAELRRRGYYVIPAKNDVLDGIRKTSQLIKAGNIRVNVQCKEILKEFSAYVWDDKAAQVGEDKPVKQYDHSLDALRYAVNSLPGWRFGNEM